MIKYANHAKLVICVFCGFYQLLNMQTTEAILLWLISQPRMWVIYQWLNTQITQNLSVAWFACFITSSPTKEDNFESCSMQNEWKIGNGVCNDELNMISCDYDGGDCCLNQVNIYACSRCLCHKDPQKCPNTNLMGNGVCDVQLQSQASCLWEWQDCSKIWKRNDFSRKKWYFLIF